MENLLELCSGRYCGRIKNESSGWSDCTACPVGYRSDDLKLCQKCVDSPDLYEWMYLGFMAMLPLTLNWLCILIYNHKWSSPAVIIQMVSSFFESFTAAILSLLIYEPRGSLTLLSCKVVQISDWYTVFFNPTIKYTTTVFCAQEAVYPLYSIVFLCYLFSLAMLVLLRPIAYSLLPKPSRNKLFTKTLYATLYFHPILVAVHAVCAGLLYYSYPYLTMFTTVLATVTYYVKCDAMTLKKILDKDLSKHIFAMVWHLLTLCAAAVSIIISTYTFLTWKNLLFLLCTPFPMIFFLLTERFSDPTNIAQEMDMMNRNTV
uniref:JNK1/MAPK8-associated membrane protein n=1 Tax=Ciona intestinalis TaxID=7719 RepID=H2XNT5_CIOIN|nr:JNK1/MAPK8-associated membrane protein [Ciona intestinalis]|eukprot:XP_002130041.1 JNK1/MAPK8-associated membrane protein [Ciona intestinalis]